MATTIKDISLEDLMSLSVQSQLSTEIIRNERLPYFCPDNNLKSKKRDARA